MKKKQTIIPLTSTGIADACSLIRECQEHIDEAQVIIDVNSKEIKDIKERYRASLIKHFEELYKILSKFNPPEMPLRDDLDMIEDFYQTVAAVLREEAFLFCEIDDNTIVVEKGFIKLICGDETYGYIPVDLFFDLNKLKNFLKELKRKNK